MSSNESERRSKMWSKNMKASFRRISDDPDVAADYDHEQQERKVREEGYKEGDKVIATAGPHKGQPHKVIHVHDDGHVAIMPTKLKGRAVKYKYGAAKAHPSQVERLSEAVRRPGSSRGQHQDPHTAYKRDFKAKELHHELGHEVDSPRRFRSKPSQPHAVHIAGKKWKTFGSKSHATNVANKLTGKGKEATVHKESNEQIHETDRRVLGTFASLTTKLAARNQYYKRKKYDSADPAKSFISTPILNKTKRLRKEDMEQVRESFTDHESFPHKDGGWVHLRQKRNQGDNKKVWSVHHDSDRAVGMDRNRVVKTASKSKAHVSDTHSGHAKRVYSDLKKKHAMDIETAKKTYSHHDHSKWHKEETEVRHLMSFSQLCEVAGKRGRPSKGEGEEGDGHIMMQVRSAQDLGGHREIKYRKGPAKQMHPKHLDHLSHYYNNLKKPGDKRRLQLAVAQSHDSATKVAKAVVAHHEKHGIKVPDHAQKKHTEQMPKK